MAQEVHYIVQGTICLRLIIRKMPNIMQHLAQLGILSFFKAINSLTLSHKLASRLSVILWLSNSAQTLPYYWLVTAQECYMYIKDVVHLAHFNTIVRLAVEIT